MPSLAVSIAVFVGSLVVLLGASEVFTSAAERIGLALGVSPFVVGATVVAAGTSLPELSASLLAQVAGEPGIVVGNVVGSNVANVLLVLGTTAAVGGRIAVDRELMRVDLPLLTASAGFLWLAVWDGVFAWYEGVLALVGLTIYLEFVVSDVHRLEETLESVLSEVRDEDVDVDPDAPREPKELTEGVTAGAKTAVVAVLSLVAVFVAANFLVESILDVAATVGVGSEVVAITAVAVGTSLPEIGVSVAAVRRGNADIAIGNVLGSNVFNTFGVMGVPSLLGVITVPASVREFALPAMLIATVLYFFIAQDQEITRYDGFALLLLYAVFVVNLFSFT
ncbi:calcium/sodium antiporter [Halorubellus salinus]|uniref:calcium/sodium antiporter n=1 Tax=Halorubellus salinus TaxID=755309 RepID=UPI001D0939C8|nr:calcium/sodium antiporter [Halorubellus salinus]